MRYIFKICNFLQLQSIDKGFIRGTTVNFQGLQLFTGDKQECIGWGYDA